MCVEREGVAGCGGQRVPSGLKAKMEIGFVPAQLANLFSGGDIPDANRVVTAGCRQAGALPTEREAEHPNRDRVAPAPSRQPAEGPHGDADWFVVQEPPQAASASSPAVAYRFPGSFSRHFRQIVLQVALRGGLESGAAGPAPATAPGAASGGSSPHGRAGGPDSSS